MTKRAEWMFRTWTEVSSVLKDLWQGIENSEPDDRTTLSPAENCAATPFDINAIDAMNYSAVGVVIGPCCGIWLDWKPCGQTQDMPTPSG